MQVAEILIHHGATIEGRDDLGRRSVPMVSKMFHNTAFFQCQKT
jgi:hypothetical protein